MAISASWRSVRRLPYSTTVPPAARYRNNTISVPLVLTDAFHVSDLLTPKMRIQFVWNLNLLTAYDRINRIYKITVRTKSCPQWRRFYRKKDNHSNHLRWPLIKPFWRVKIKRKHLINQRIHYLFLTYLIFSKGLSHFFKGCVPWFSLTNNSVLIFFA